MVGGTTPYVTEWAAPWSRHDRAGIAFVHRLFESIHVGTVIPLFPIPLIVKNITFYELVHFREWVGSREICIIVMRRKSISPGESSHKQNETCFVTSWHTTVTVLICRKTQPVWPVWVNTLSTYFSMETFPIPRAPIYAATRMTLPVLIDLL